MSTFSHLIESVTPDEKCGNVACAGANVSCAGVGFKLEGGDKKLIFGGGSLRNANNDQGYTIEKAEFFDYEEGFFTIKLPITIQAGEYEIKIYFYGDNKENIYEFDTDFSILNVDDNPRYKAQLKRIVPNLVSKFHLSDKIFTVTGQNVLRLTTLLLKKVNGDGPGEFILEEKESEKQFIKFKVTTPSSIVKSGTYIVQGVDKESGETILCDEVLKITNN